MRRGQELRRRTLGRDPALLDPEPSIALPDLEQAIALRLRLVGLNTIRRRILAFGALATLIPSLITGTIWKITTEIGAAVSEGDTVIIMESMKMEMPVEAPSAGKVASIAVAEAQAVDEGQTLLVLE